MIKGVGIDLVELQRVQELVSEQYIDDILSLKEKKIYQNLVSDEAKLSFLGGRLAAKEAIFKAIATDKGSTKHNEWSIINRPDGKPVVETDYFTQNEVAHVTITHTDSLAIGYAVIETK